MSRSVEPFFTSSSPPPGIQLVLAQIDLALALPRRTLTFNQELPSGPLPRHRYGATRHYGETRRRYREVPRVEGNRTSLTVHRHKETCDCRDGDGPRRQSSSRTSSARKHRRRADSEPPSTGSNYVSSLKHPDFEPPESPGFPDYLSYTSDESEPLSEIDEESDCGDDERGKSVGACGTAGRDKQVKFSDPTNAVSAANPDAGNGAAPVGVDANQANGKIAKPEGEPGRPGRGGYNLETCLGWDTKEFRVVRRYVRSLVDEHLDSSKALSFQDPEALEVVYEKAADKYPRLNNYADQWASKDLVRGILKYSVGRERLASMKRQLGKSKVSLRSGVTKK